MGVVIRMWVWLECIGVVSGCCCKEVYSGTSDSRPTNSGFTPYSRR